MTEYKKQKIEELVVSINKQLKLLSDIIKSIENEDVDYNIKLKYDDVYDFNRIVLNITRHYYY